MNTSLPLQLSPKYSSHPGGDSLADNQHLTHNTNTAAPTAHSSSPSSLSSHGGPTVVMVAKSVAGMQQQEGGYLKIREEDAKIYKEGWGQTCHFARTVVGGLATTYEVEGSNRNRN